ncbi:MAG: AAA family ATPase [Magnetococcales bacterium]|nr:AAA family ATPase [Magnetococcales bacterium]
MVAQKEAYLDFLGLKRNPFPVSPDNEYFFLPSRIDALISEVLHSIFTRKGFLVITGEVGLGKTTISQRILRLLDGEGVESALVFNTFLQGLDLLNEIVKDFGIETQDVTFQGRIEALNRFLMDRYAAGKNCAIIIDDAQNLSTESLELIRMISNLETNAEKLVQILLVGQPELIDKLNTHEMRQLKSRVVVHAEVRPLSQEELKQYVYFKLSTAGSQGGIQITDRIFKTMHALTAGNPRRINNLLDRCLYGLFAYNTHRISKRLLLEVAAEVGFGMPKWPWKRWLPLGGVVTAGLVVAGGLTWFLLHPGFMARMGSAGGDPSVSLELAKAKTLQQNAEAEAAKARAAQEKARSEEARAKAAQEAARNEIAQTRAAQERAQMEVSQAQIREAQALTRVAQSQDGKVDQALQDALAQARKVREEAENKVQEAEKAMNRATEDAKLQGDLLRQSIEARQKSEQEGKMAQEELAKIKQAIQEQTKALTMAFADQEKAQAETAEARKQEAQARAEAGARAREIAELAKQGREQEEKLSQAKALREQAETEASKARADAAQAMTQAEEVKKNAQSTVAKIKQELAERELDWQKERRKFLDDIRATQADAATRITDSEKQAGSILDEFRKSRSAAGSREAGKENIEKRLTDLDAARQKAENEAKAMRIEVEKSLAKAETAQKRAEEMQKEYQKRQVNLSADQMQNQLVELQKARERAEAEAQAAKKQIALMQEQAQQAQKMVRDMQSRLQANRGEPGQDFPVAPEVHDFLARYGLERYEGAFSRGLQEGMLGAVEQKIVRETGYGLVQLDRLPPEVAQKKAFLARGLPDGTKKYLFFWQPPFWMDVIYFGQTGEEIRKLQDALTKKGVYAAPVDGEVGRYTLAALAHFQKMAGVPLTGRPDSATLYHLLGQPGVAVSASPGKMATPLPKSTGHMRADVAQTPTAAVPSSPGVAQTSAAAVPSSPGVAQASAAAVPSSPGVAQTSAAAVPSSPGVVHSPAGAVHSSPEVVQTPTGKVSPHGKGQWVVQVASFVSQPAAEYIVNTLKENGFSVFTVPVRSADTGRLWVTVRVGPVATYRDAETLSNNLVRHVKQKGIILKHQQEVPSVDGQGDPGTVSDSSS